MPPLLQFRVESRDNVERVQAMDRGCIVDAFRLRGRAADAAHALFLERVRCLRELRHFLSDEHVSGDCLLCHVRLLTIGRAIFVWQAECHARLACFVGITTNEEIAADTRLLVWGAARAWRAMTVSEPSRIPRT